MAKRSWPAIPSSEITPEPTFLSRRQFVKGVALAAGAVALAACAAPARPAPSGQSGGPAATTLPPAGAGLLPLPDAAPKAGKTTDELGAPLTSHEAVTTYNNFYEFGQGKDDPARNAQGFVTSPWTLQVGGLVNQPKTYGVDDLIRKFPPEERIYRLRCVEAWSMVIPWLGFSLAKLLKEVEPQSGAKYVRFETLNDPKRMPGEQSGFFSWPYVEGLRLDEAMNGLGSVFCWRTEPACWWAVMGRWCPSFAFGRLPPVIGDKRRFRGRSHAQRIQVTHWSRWRSSYCEGTLAGMPIMAFTL